MNGSVVVSETHQVVQRKCFDLNERLQESYYYFILFYFICIIFLYSFILKYGVDFFNLVLI